MRKRTITAAALLVALALAGCSNGNAAKTTTAASSAAPETTTTTTTTAAETTTEAPETTTEAPVTEDNSGKVPLFSMGDVTLYGSPDAFEQHEYPEYDCGLARISTGTYFDSSTNPDYFVTDEFTYKGETAPLGEFKAFKVGDKIGGLTVTEASTAISPLVKFDEDDNVIFDRWEVDYTNLAFEGEVTLSGYVRYYFDEQYTINSGDIHFIPDASYAGLPVPINFNFMLNGENFPNGYGFTDFDEKGGYSDRQYGGNVCIYTDAPVFAIGNLNRDYSKHAEMYEIFDGGNADCTKKVEVTLSDIRVSFSDQFGTRFCYASIKNIKEID